MPCALSEHATWSGDYFARCARIAPRAVKLHQSSYSCEVRLLTFGSESNEVPSEPCPHVLG